MTRRHWRPDTRRSRGILIRIIDKDRGEHAKVGKSNVSVLIMTFIATTILTDWARNAVTNAMLKPVSKMTITAFMLWISTLDLSALTLMNARLDLMTVMHMQHVLIYSIATPVNVVPVLTPLETGMMSTIAKTAMNATMDSRQLYLGPNKNNWVDLEIVHSEQITLLVSIKTKSTKPMLFI